MSAKRTVFFAACLLLLIVSRTEAADKVIEIRDKMFLAQTEDIYINAPDYMGSAVRYEGIYTSFPPAFKGDETLHVVFRRAPGCCGNDGMAGFIVAWDGDYPDPDAWVKVEGVLETADSGDLQIRLSSLSVLEKRGQEFVTQ
jgi:putative membrane protein